MTQNQKGFGLLYVLILGLVLTVILGVGLSTLRMTKSTDLVTAPPSKHPSPNCEKGAEGVLEQQFIIGKDCFTKIKDTGLEVDIMVFLTAHALQILNVSGQA